MSGIDRRILSAEAFCLRKKLPRCISSALRTGVLLPPEDGFRQMIGSFGGTLYSPIPYTPEQLEEWARREREKIAICRLYGEAYYRDVYNLNQWMWSLVFEQAKEEVAKEQPDWVRQWPELFKTR